MIDYNQGLIIQMKFEDKIELKRQLLQIYGMREQSKILLEQKQKSKKTNYIKFNLSENNVIIDNGQNKSKSP